MLPQHPEYTLSPKQLSPSAESPLHLPFVLRTYTRSCCLHNTLRGFHPLPRLLQSWNDSPHNK